MSFENLLKIKRKILFPLPLSHSGLAQLLSAHASPFLLLGQDLAGCPLLSSLLPLTRGARLSASPPHPATALGPSILSTRTATTGAPLSTPPLSPPRFAHLDAHEPEPPLPLPFRSLSLPLLSLKAHKERHRSHRDSPRTSPSI